MQGIAKSLEELEDESDQEVYKSVGEILVKKDRDELVEDLEDEHEKLETRKESLSKKEERLQQKMQETQQKFGEMR